MPRGPRLNLIDGIYHVMSRGNRKAPIFEDDFDRERFIDIVAEAAYRHDVRVFAESRLGNHYHQVVQTPRANLPSYMGCLNQNFAQFSNYRHHRIGHLFNERYQPILVDNDLYLRVATAYVLANPVKHGFVSNPGNWKWSSYRATVGLEARPNYLHLDWLLSACPSESLEDAQLRYRRYLETPGEQDSEDWTDGPVFGGSGFEREVREHIGAMLFMAALPRSYRALARPSLAELFPPGMATSERNRQMLRANIVHAYRIAEIARALDMNPSSVSRIVAALRRKTRDRGR
jgi:REP element-mobilizing transposase RayT